MTGFEITLLKELHNYFGAEVGGSYLLYKEGHLSFEDINDIDLFIKSYSYNGVVNYLKDNKYIQVTNRRPYGGVENTDYFERPLYKTIHIIKDDNFKQYSTAKLLKSKFERADKKDYIQIHKYLTKWLKAQKS